MFKSNEARIENKKLILKARVLNQLHLQEEPA